jgi:hypothetical protein
MSDGACAPGAAVRLKEPVLAVPPAEGELLAGRAYISGVPAGTHLSKDV